MIKLDPSLTSALFHGESSETIPTTIGKGEFGKRIESKLQIYHSIVLDGDPDGPNVKFQRGPVQPIEVIVEQRSGKKQMSRIIGLERFGIDSTPFAKEMARLYSASATVNEIQQGNKTSREVLVQGNICNEFPSRMNELYQIPKDLIKLPTSTASGKKK